MSSENLQTKWGQFILIIVFFFWVLLALPMTYYLFSKGFMLSQVQSQLVAWAFYVAYFVGSIIFFLVSLKLMF
jgi:FHS family L-fucose permease-like MFS transporter